jgi:acyl-coenzyme A synthetase/AMP-(fatty) acid ligase
VPKYIDFMDGLPKTPNGKIDKKQLKAKAEASISS